MNSIRKYTRKSVNITKRAYFHFYDPQTRGWMGFHCFDVFFESQAEEKFVKRTQKNFHFLIQSHLPFIKENCSREKLSLCIYCELLAQLGVYIFRPLFWTINQGQFGEERNKRLLIFALICFLSFAHNEPERYLFLQQHQNTCDRFTNGACGFMPSNILYNFRFVSHENISISVHDSWPCFAQKPDVK